MMGIQKKERARSYDSVFLFPFLSMMFLSLFVSLFDRYPVW